MDHLTCKEGGNLSTWDLGFIYFSSEGRVGWEFIHPSQPTVTPSSRRSSWSHFYTPGFPWGWPLLEDSASREEKPGAYSTPCTPSGRNDFYIKTIFIHHITYLSWNNNGQEWDCHDIFFKGDRVTHEQSKCI